MTAPVYRKLATVLDTLPNGFPATPDGLELELLQKVFTEEEAELFCDLKLTPETAPQIAERTGRPLEGLEERLTSMTRRGELLGVELAGTRLFAMMPWVVGIYEFQISRMDREFCELCEEYARYLGPQLLGYQPHVMQSVPVNQQITARQEALPYVQVASIIEQGQAFRVNQCICKKERGLLDSPCKKPTEVCLSISPIPNADFIFEWGRPISREQAYQLLRDAEDAGLVHLTSNVGSGHTFICNCCGCCCGVLRPMNEFGVTGVINSRFYAEIDPDTCDNCGVCVAERCQVAAIEQGDITHQVIKARCIGCGLCVPTCPTEAIKLLSKPPEEIVPPPASQQEWNEERARARGTDYSAYK